MNKDRSDHIPTEPQDEHNQRLLDNVHPAEWQNPVPEGRYNLVVIGAGTAGLIVAAGAAGLGARVALVERHLMGGDCLNTGCVPSKSMIRSARAAAAVTEAGRFGVKNSGTPQVDFEQVMERVRSIRAGISRHDSAQRFKELGVDVYLGQATFGIDHTVRVGETVLHYKKAVIATGARAHVPGIPGLDRAGYVTNETVFNLTRQPARLAVIGAGPIGCELAQAFRRFGSEVNLLSAGAQFLSREDVDAAAVLETRFRSEGIRFFLGVKSLKVEIQGGEKKVSFEKEGNHESVLVDEILVGTGRVPNVEGMNLGTVGVEFDARKGVHVDDRLRTSNPDIFAAGDICSAFKFTHAAEAAAKIVIQNALFGGRKRASKLRIPWCTYTDPEIAHVGLTEKEAALRKLEIDTYRIRFDELDRAITEGETEGFVKIHVAKGRDQILGATLVGAHAGEMITEITLAMQARIGLGRIADVIHPYPTQAEAIKRAAYAYNRTRLTPRVKKIFEVILSWQRR